MFWAICYCSYLEAQCKTSCILPADGISEKVNKQHMSSDSFTKTQSLQAYS